MTALPGVLVSKFLSSPISGLLPWITFSLIEGEGRLELSAGVAFGIALALLSAQWIRDKAPKFLEYSDVVYFGALAILVAVTSDDVHRWLELWGGEVANLALLTIVAISIVARKPFTLAYAKEDTPPEYWDSPGFLRANYLISGVWAAAFFIEAASGLYGDAVLHNSNNLWTGWVIQTVPIIVAAQFTLWYPARLDAIAEDRTPPPVSAFLAQVTPLFTIVGVIALFVGDSPWWLGAAFIVAGVALTKYFSSQTPTPPPR